MTPNSSPLMAAMALTFASNFIATAQTLKADHKTNKTMHTHFEKITINNSTQYVLVRGKSVNAPLLIHVQAGPGLPMISEANEMEKQLHLEKDFLVAYWDQRGCGLSYSKDVAPETINLSQMTDDVIAVTKYLLKKYNKDNALMVGYSIGATLSTMAAAKESSLFNTIVAVGIDVDIPFANQFALDYALQKAMAKNDKKLVKAINELSQHPIVESKAFQKRAQILTDLGGIKANTTFASLTLSTVKHMLTSKYYRIRGTIKSVKGMSFCQNALVLEFNTFNLFDKVKKLAVPVHFVQGGLDGIAPPEKGKEFFENLDTPSKSFSLFEKSAHTPQYDEPEKFASLVLSVARKSNLLMASK